MITPTLMRFSGARAGGVSWAWDFGDGTTSTAMNPAHTYTEGGTYDAALEVTYADGETASKTIAVNRKHSAITR